MLRAQAKWLNKMARRGWRLADTGKLDYSFVPCEPGEYQYAGGEPGLLGVRRHIRRAVRGVYGAHTEPSQLRMRIRRPGRTLRAAGFLCLHGGGIGVDVG